MLKLGVIGMNEGNGHPYSYSAIFNGYDPKNLQEKCPFALIKDYLPKEHRNENFIDGARVTHIWTQDRSISQDIAAVSLIPNVVNSLEDLIGSVDAVILARDDPWNHLKMAEPFLRHGTPLFIDKQLVSSVEDFEALMPQVPKQYPMMAGSSARFTRDLASTKSQIDKNIVRSIHGVSRSSWMRYGHHLLEGIVDIWGIDIPQVQSLSSDPNHDIIQFQYQHGPNVILECIKDASLPIQFTCFSEGQDAAIVPFTDYFYSFREMLKGFVRFVETGTRCIDYDEMIFISRLVLAGDISKKLNRPVSPHSFKEI